MKLKKYLLPAILFASGLLSAQDFYTVFAKGKWDPAQWFEVKSTHFKRSRGMVQQDDHIMNEVPDLPDEELYAKHKLYLYSCLVLDRKFSLPSLITCTMSFDHLMAPLIVIAPDFGKNAEGKREQRDHFEIVLFNQGLNIWRHSFENGKSSYYLAGYLKTDFRPKTRYNLQVKIFQNRYGKQLEVTCGGHCFAIRDNSLPDTFYAGIIGCEGRNRFYDFGVRSLRKKKKRK
jgi:hypothetical protein